MFGTVGRAPKEEERDLVFLVLEWCTSQSTWSAASTCQEMLSAPFGHPSTQNWAISHLWSIFPKGQRRQRLSWIWWSGPHSNPCSDSITKFILWNPISVAKTYTGPGNGVISRIKKSLQDARFTLTSAHTKHFPHHYLLTILTTVLRGRPASLSPCGRGVIKPEKKKTSYPMRCLTHSHIAGFLKYHQKSSDDIITQLFLD